MSKDSWVANHTRDRLMAARGYRPSHESGQSEPWKPVMMIDNEGMPHDFCTTISMHAVPPRKPCAMLMSDRKQPQRCKQGEDLDRWNHRDASQGNFMTDRSLWETLHPNATQSITTSVTSRTGNTTEAHSISIMTSQSHRTAKKAGLPNQVPITYISLSYFSEISHSSSVAKASASHLFKGS